jgi:hypothetical protein
MIEEFYHHDKKTAYIFTADHGMTDWGEWHMYFCTVYHMKNSGNHISKKNTIMLNFQMPRRINV